MLINTETLRAVNKGFTSLYDASFGKAQPKWPRVAMRVSSTTASNVYGWLGSSTRVREWIGDRVLQNLKAHDFEIKNKDFEATITVDRNAIEDDQLGVFSPAVEDLGDAAANFPDELVFGLLAGAFTTLCYDGQYLVDTDHPVLDANGNAVSVSNSGGGSGAPWFLIDDSKAIKPIIFQDRKSFAFTALDNPEDPNVFMRKEFVYGVDARMNVGTGVWQLIYGSKQDLTAANFSAGKEAMQSLKGDHGRPLRVTPRILVVGPSNEDAANEIVKAERNAAGATNIHRGTVEVVVVPWLP